MRKGGCMEELQCEKEGIRKHMYAGEKRKTLYRKAHERRFIAGFLIWPWRWQGTADNESAPTRQKKAVPKTWPFACRRFHRLRSTETNDLLPARWETPANRVDYF